MTMFPGETEITDLVAAMTLEEKAGLCSGADFWRTKGVPRLGIPPLMMSDGPQGLRTQKPGSENPNESVEAVSFPCGCALAAGFDPLLAERMGHILGRECRALGVGMLLGPALNIKRSPLCGRNFEYYSEDPYLSGALAAAFVRGVQREGVAAAPKHFAANSQEYRRLTTDSVVDERTLREIYLPAFEALVKEAQPQSLMCSYNRVNGVYASESRALLNDILREEWGFAGFVVSDWGAVADRVDALAAGLELEMPASGGVNDAKIVAAVQNGRLDEAVLDRAVTRLLRVILRVTEAARQSEAPPLDRVMDHHLAAQLAEECAVLLENKGALPLRRGQKVVYIGSFAQTPRYQGGGSGHINTGWAVSALHAAEVNSRGVNYLPGFPADHDERNEAEFLSAITAAQNADTAVIFAGLPDYFESEGCDRRTLHLPECQNNLIARVAAVQKNTVVVLHTGAPVECPWANDVNAILCMYLAGEGVGTAEDALLWGDATPAGRLPESWPLRLEDTPSYLDFPGDGVRVPYREGVYVGYRWYDARKMPVRWPFGHGMTYTGFVYKNARMSAAVFDADAEDAALTVAVDVLNSGSADGAEVVQLYVADTTGRPVPGGKVPQALRGSQKLWLHPGELGTATFTLTARDFSWYSVALQDWYANPGRYELRLAHSSRDARVTLPLTLQTARRLPLTVDENTPFGILLADDRTAAVAQAAVDALGGAFANGGADAGLMSPDAMAQMLDGLPLRSLVAFGGPEAAKELPGLLHRLQAAAAN